MLHGYGLNETDDEFFQGHREDRGPLPGMLPASAETAVGGYGTPSPVMAHIAHESGVVQQRWDWINQQAQESAMHPPEVY